MKKFEYRLVSQKDVDRIRDRSVADFLNELGDKGWELCGIDYGCFILKRGKIEQPDHRGDVWDCPG